MFVGCFWHSQCETIPKKSSPSNRDTESFKFIWGPNPDPSRSLGAWSGLLKMGSASKNRWTEDFFHQKVGKNLGLDSHFWIVGRWKLSFYKQSSCGGKNVWIIHLCKPYGWLENCWDIIFRTENENDVHDLKPYFSEFITSSMKQLHKKNRPLGLGWNQTHFCSSKRVSFKACTTWLLEPAQRCFDPRKERENNHLMYIWRISHAKPHGFKKKKKTTLLKHLLLQVVDLMSPNVKPMVLKHFSCRIFWISTWNQRYCGILYAVLEFLCLRDGPIQNRGYRLVQRPPSLWSSHSAPPTQIPKQTLLTWACHGL